MKSQPWELKAEIKDGGLVNFFVRVGQVKIAWRAKDLIRRDGIRRFSWKVLLWVAYGQKWRHILTRRDYYGWIKKQEIQNIREIKAQIETFKHKPKISVIVPVYNVDPRWLDKCILSVVDQYYENWELCLYDDASTNRETVDCLKKWQKKNDPMIKVGLGKKNQHISGASNEALKMATGEFVALLDNDDELAPFALYENVKVLNKHPEADFIYSDEDKIDARGRRGEPFFKPDWSPDLFLTNMYTNHLGVYRKKIIDKINGFRVGYEGAQDYDLVLRFIKETDAKKIKHIPKILYHWRMLESSTAQSSESKLYTETAGQRALSDYIRRNKIKGAVFNGSFSNTFRVKREILGNPKVSIIVPFRDQVKILKTCIDSILAKTRYQNYEIVLIDNASKQVSTSNYLEKIKNNPIVKVERYNKPFNYSAINNFGVTRASGEYVILLNNDTQVISMGWMDSMLEQAQQKEVGAVGAKLLFPNDAVQHAGIVLSANIASDTFKHVPKDIPSFFGHASIIRNYSAVTGACMMVKKSIYKKVGGLDEKNLKIAYNDVDFCLKLLEEGYRNVYTPYAELYHHESLSRGNDEALKKDDPRRCRRTLRERQYIKEKWHKYIKYDPYYSPNLSPDGQFNIRIS